MERFHSHLSLMKIKKIVKSQANFFFKSVSGHAAKQVIEGLPSNKPTTGEITIKIFKESRFTFEDFT